jgi:hypothetical protein
MKKIALSILLLVSLSFVSNAQQWYKLQAYKDPFAGNTNISPGSSVYPILPIVASNGVISYMATGYIGNFQDMEMAESKNDLNSCNNIYSPGYTYLIESFIARNDSTYCLISCSYSTNPTIYYTSNNFSSGQSLNLNLSDFPGVTASACFSTNYIYATCVDPLHSPDTIKVFRVNMKSAIDTEFNIVRYKSPRSLWFTSDSVGYLLCTYKNDSAKSVLAITKDSGKTWNDCFLDSTHVITACSFPTASTGYITENNGNIYKTTDGGITWNKLSSPTSGNVINCISFSNDTGYIGCNVGLLYYTTNGGTSWTMSLANTSYNVTSLYTFGKVVYFVDNNNDIYKNQSPMAIESLQAGANEVKVYPNPSNGKFAIELIIKNEELGINHTIELYNILGERIYLASLPQTPKGALSTIDLGGEANGIYFYKIHTEKGEFVASGKLVIQK